MKNKLAIYFSAIALVFSSVSCNDFLDQVNPNELSTGSFWLNLNDCETGLVAVYKAFQNTKVMGLSANSTRSDLTYPGYGRPNTTNEYYQQQFTSGSTEVNNLWDGNYQGIFYANQVISGLKGVEHLYVDNEDQYANWIDCMAQARFFRGLFHFYLHSMFNQGNIIIFDFVPQNSSQYAQPLSASADVIDFFRADLKYAYDNLPGTREEVETGRITKGAAGSVLGKSHLYQEEYEEAYNYFVDVATNYGYALADISENITTKGEFNSESILEIAYSRLLKPEEDVYSSVGVHNILAMYVSPVGGWRSMLPSLWFADALRNDPMDMADERNSVSDYWGNPRMRSHSLRSSYTCAWPDDKDLLYYGDTTHTTASFNNKECAYFRKLSNWDITDSEKTLLTKSGVNYRVIRLADIYLMMAECLIQGGNNGAGVQAGLNLINKVRYRSALRLLGSKTEGEYVNSTYDEKVYTAEDVMNHLMYVERPLELNMEGFCIRQIDMRRWGITKDRFEQLSQTPYYFGDYEYFVEEKGKVEKKHKWGAMLFAGENPTEGGDTFYDFEQAAMNYIESEHAYFPIPNSEETANNRLYEVIGKE